MVTNRIPDQLRRRLREKRVIPFVGSGVSRSVLSAVTGQPMFPTWRGLLGSAAIRIEKETGSPNAQIVDGFLKKSPPDFLEAARNAYEGLPGQLWVEFLKDEFDPLFDDVDKSSLLLPKAIWSLGSNLVITTNYDKVLDWTAPQSADLERWVVELTAEQISALRNLPIERPTIWHFHGFIQDVESIILTPNGYSRLYPAASTNSETEFTAALTTLNSLLMSQTFLFVGYGLNDEYIGSHLRGIQEVFKGHLGPHYILVREAELERYNEHISRDKLPLLAISFPDFGQPLLDLLDELSKVAEETGTNEPAQQVPSVEFRAADQTSDPEKGGLYD